MQRKLNIVFGLCCNFLMFSKKIDCRMLLLNNQDFAAFENDYKLSL